ncbi:hypothetical protein EON65_38755 [archaeon]|nr:MAG: hypothetical protein EON65_38755 [archaeon]
MIVILRAFRVVRVLTHHNVERILYDPVNNHCIMTNALKVIKRSKFKGSVKMAALNRLKEYTMLPLQKLREIAAMHSDIVLIEDASTNVRRVSITHHDKQTVGWVINEDVRNCMECAAQFGLLKRQHHCRQCGNIICHKCCRMTTLQVMQHLGSVRVCKSCIKGNLHPAIHHDTDQVTDSLPSYILSHVDSKLSHTCESPVGTQELTVCGELHSGESLIEVVDSVVTTGSQARVVEVKGASLSASSLKLNHQSLDCAVATCSGMTETSEEGDLLLPASIVGHPCSSAIVPLIESSVEDDLAIRMPLTVGDIETSIMLEQQIAELQEQNQQLQEDNKNLQEELCVLEQDFEKLNRDDRKQIRSLNATAKDAEAKYNASIKGIQSLTHQLTCVMSELEEMKARKAELEANNARQVTNIATLSAKIYSLKQDMRNSVLEDKSEAVKRSSMCQQCAVYNTHMFAYQKKAREQRRLLKTKEDEFARLYHAYKSLQADHVSLIKVQEVDRKLTELVQFVKGTTVHPSHSIIRADKVVKSLMTISEKMTRLAQHDNKENSVSALLFLDCVFLLIYSQLQLFHFTVIYSNI